MKYGLYKWLSVLMFRLLTSLHSNHEADLNNSGLQCHYHHKYSPGTRARGYDCEPARYKLNQACKSPMLIHAGVHLFQREPKYPPWTNCGSGPHSLDPGPCQVSSGVIVLYRFALIVFQLAKDT